MTEPAKPQDPIGLDLIRLYPWADSAAPEWVSVTRMLAVGREGSCEWVLDEDSVSRRHALLRPIENSLEVTDIESHNGTFVDDLQVRDTTQAEIGQILRFGRCLYLAVPLGRDYRGWWKEGNEGPIIGGAFMSDVRRMVKRLGPEAGPVLISGQRGTGKEVVATAIHRASGRSGNLVMVDCATVSDDDVEKHLFGAPGSNNRGFFREAHKGTVVLDAVDALPMSVQEKVLKVIELQEITPPGQTAASSVDVRVVALTRKDLQAEVENGTFRDDLAVQLRAFSIPLLPLKNRREDVVLLTVHFLKSLEVKAIHHSAIKALLRHMWPDNAWELRGVLAEGAAKAAALKARTIGRAHLPSAIARPSDPES